MTRCPSFVCSMTTHLKQANLLQSKQKHSSSSLGVFCIYGIYVLTPCRIRSHSWLRPHDWWSLATESVCCGKWYRNTCHSLDSRQQLGACPRIYNSCKTDIDSSCPLWETSKLDLPVICWHLVWDLGFSSADRASEHLVVTMAFQECCPDRSCSRCENKTGSLDRWRYSDIQDTPDSEQWHSLMPQPWFEFYRNTRLKKKKKHNT